MKRKMMFLMLTLWTMSAASVKSQVTIGSNEDPHGGALLDLSRAGNSKGFLLPRVHLDKVDEWQIDGNKENGTGMMVYNINKRIENGSGCGIYAWNGSVWAPVGTDDCSSVTDIDNNTYLAAKFGAAGCWMTENLRTTKYADGTALTANSDAGSDTSLKYYWYPNNDKTTLDAHPEYGLVYTWAAATNRTGVTTDEANKSTQTQVQGICPIGWHLPSDYEFNELEKVIALSDANVYSTTGPVVWESTYSTTVGARGAHGLKMTSETAIAGNATNGTSFASDMNGFNGLLSGIMTTNGEALHWGTHADWWLSSSYSSTHAWYRPLYLETVTVNRSRWPKTAMFSVRCKKNDN